MWIFANFIIYITRDKKKSKSRYTICKLAKNLTLDFAGFELSKSKGGVDRFMVVPRSRRHWEQGEGVLVHAESLNPGMPASATGQFNWGLGFHRPPVLRHAGNVRGGG